MSNSTTTTMQASHHPTAQEALTHSLHPCSFDCPIPSNYSCSITREIALAQHPVNDIASPMCYTHRARLLTWLDKQRRGMHPKPLFLLSGLGYSRRYSHGDTPADTVAFDVADTMAFPPLLNANPSHVAGSQTQDTFYGVSGWGEGAFGGCLVDGLGVSLQYEYNGGPVELGFDVADVEDFPPLSASSGR